MITDPQPKFSVPMSGFVIEDTAGNKHVALLAPDSTAPLETYAIPPAGFS